MQEKKETFRLGQAIKNVLIGIVLGIANIIPGVSGGTMAVVTGVFDKLIAILTFDFKVIKRQWKFILTLVLGMAIAIFGFSWVIKHLLANFPIATNFFFVGVVLGTCPFIGKQTFSGKGNWAAKILPMVLTIGLLVWMTIAQADLEKSAVAILPQNFATMVQLFFVMILAAAAMIIPGISGSFVALALGAYPTVIEAISTLNIILLIPIVLGVLLGLIGGARLIQFLLQKFPKATFSAILGLLIGSVISLVYPLIPQMVWNVELMVGILVAVGGFVLANFFCKSEAKAE